MTGTPQSKEEKKLLGIRPGIRARVKNKSGGDAIQYERWNDVRDVPASHDIRTRVLGMINFNFEIPP